MWLLFCLLEEPSPLDLVITKARGVQEDKKANRGINHSRPLQSTSLLFFCNILIRFLLSGRISVTGSRNSFHCPVRRGSEVWLLFFTITFWIFPPLPSLHPYPLLSLLSSPTEICAADCGGHGVCVGGTCRCEEGWMGTACDQRACHPRCNEHGTCRDGKCECSPGWNGEHCTIGREKEKPTAFQRVIDDQGGGKTHA